MVTLSCYQSVKPITILKSSGSASGTGSGKIKTMLMAVTPKQA
jgi:hypothetical protein